MKNKNVKALTKKIKEMEAAKKGLEKEMLSKIGKTTFNLCQNNFDIVKLKNDVEIIIKEYGFEKEAIAEEENIILKQSVKDKKREEKTNE